MKITIPTEKPVVIELDVNGTIHEIEFYPTDLRTRQAFYEVYEKLKAYQPKEITPTTDEHGVSGKELDEARELRRFTEFLAEQVDDIFGAGTAQKITDGRCSPHGLISFICQMAVYFQKASDSLIRRYIADESGVME